MPQHGEQVPTVPFFISWKMERDENTTVLLCHFELSVPSLVSGFSCRPGPLVKSPRLNCIFIQGKLTLKGYKVPGRSDWLDVVWAMKSCCEMTGSGVITTFTRQSKHISFKWLVFIVCCNKNINKKILLCALELGISKKHFWIKSLLPLCNCSKII